VTGQVRVLIADKMDPKAASIFRERGIAVEEKPGLSPDELAAIIGNYDGLAVRSSTRVTAPIMDAALPRLKVIGRAGIGVDTIDVPAASARGIVVMNTPFGNSITTAEHAIAMLFALAREIPQADQSTNRASGRRTDSWASNWQARRSASSAAAISVRSSPTARTASR
jgi:D-3-phosphoglycerate dehydrogenase